MEDFYPMPMFVNLQVADILQSSAWYQRALGFRVVFEMPSGEPILVHLRRSRYQDILLFPGGSGDPQQAGNGVIIQFQADDEPVKDIAVRARSAGAREVHGPIERPWNVREVTVVDPDGFQLRFSEPIDTTRNFKDVIG